MERVRKCCFTEILTTRLDQSCTLHFQLGLTKFFKFNIFAMMGLIRNFRKYFCIHQKFKNIFWTRQHKLLQVIPGIIEDPNDPSLTIMFFMKCCCKLSSICKKHSTYTKHSFPLYKGVLRQEYLIYLTQLADVLFQGFTTHQGKKTRS